MQLEKIEWTRWPKVLFLFLSIVANAASCLGIAILFLHFVIKDVFVEQLQSMFKNLW